MASPPSLPPDTIREIIPPSNLSPAEVAEIRRSFRLARNGLNEFAPERLTQRLFKKEWWPVTGKYCEYRYEGGKPNHSWQDEHNATADLHNCIQKALNQRSREIGGASIQQPD